MPGPELTLERPPTVELARALIPMDERLLGGVAIQGSVTDHHLELLAFRLEEAFGIVHGSERKPKEDNLCIAYATSPEPGVPAMTSEDTENVERRLIFTALKQNHGMRTFKEVDSSGEIIWTGDDHTATRYFVHRWAGLLVMTDAAKEMVLVDGVVISLKSERHAPVVEKRR